MKSLLTPSESHAFQSFLSSLDTPVPEWALYSSGGPGDIVIDVPVPQAQGREALARATKELMSLDAGRWHPHQGSVRHSQLQDHRQQLYDYQRQPHNLIGEHQQQHQQQQRTSISHDPFPFLNAHVHKRPQSLPRPQHQERPISDSLQLLTNNTAHHLCPLTVLSSLHANGGPNSPTNTASSATTPSSGTSAPVYPFSPTGTTSSSVNDAQSHRSDSPRPKKQQIPASQRQALLSPSQKKANHIQSEQKRRANIRRGYSALCETVPALREAIMEEEKRETETQAMSGRNGSVGKSRKGKRKEIDNADGTDRRAGPRSESVVLSKSACNFFHLPVPCGGW
ncbi:hypothetical protein AX15_004448 [Amanita polypyramis BW_CC]|nr:hypothetical protein AX15_004448 [Amanita polypyramis BW_CC]